MPVASQCRYTNMTNLPWIQIKHIQQKIIRMFDLNTNWLRCSTRKIGNVERHQGFSGRMTGRSKHMPILFTALHPWNQILISAHQRIGERRLHLANTLAGFIFANALTQHSFQLIQHTL